MRKPQKKKKVNFDTSKLWICGKHSVFSVIKNPKRKIFEILTTKNNQLDLRNFLKKEQIPKLETIVKITDNEKISNLVGHNQTHQGIAVRCSKLPIKNQINLLAELKLKKDGKLPTLLLLDQLTDPHNVGAIIRSAVSFGIKKIIFCEHNAPQENATINKASAGCIELIDLIVVTNFNNLIEKLKKLDYWCVGLAGEAKTNIEEIKGYDNIALVIGSEGDGIRPLVKKNCDILTRINIDKKVESLNASVATSIALYELNK